MDFETIRLKESKDVTTIILNRPEAMNAMNLAMCEELEIALKQFRAHEHWLSAARATGISKSSVRRFFHLFGMRPHRVKSFKLSTDPYFVEKVREIVGLCLNPPDHAVVFCADEKSQIQALGRTQPALPIGLGYVELSPTTTSAMGQPRFLQPCTLQKEQCSPSANLDIGTRSF